MNTTSMQQQALTPAAPHRKSNGAFFRQAYDDVIACLEALASVRSPGLAMFLMIVSLILTWFLYVGVHEMLHVAGCLITGGGVTRLEMSPTYGAHLYAKVFPFVVPGGEYAGRLTGFDTKGSDWIYFATDFLPFVLSIVIGVPLIKIAARRARPILLGTAVVLGLAPFYNLQGDYYEMGSMLTTRIMTIAKNGFGQPPVCEKLRSDDVFTLIANMFSKPAELGLDSGGKMAAGIIVVLISALVGLLLVFATYWMGHLFATRILRLQPN